MANEVDQGGLSSVVAYAMQSEGGVWPAMQRDWAPEEWPPERR